MLCDMDLSDFNEDMDDHHPPINYQALINCLSTDTGVSSRTKEDEDEMRDKEYFRPTQYEFEKVIEEHLKYYNGKNTRVVFETIKPGIEIGATEVISATKTSDEPPVENMENNEKSPTLDRMFAACYSANQIIEGTASSANGTEVTTNMNGNEVMLDPNNVYMPRYRDNLMSYCPLFDTTNYPGCFIGLNNGSDYKIISEWREAFTFSTRKFQAPGLPRNSKINIDHEGVVLSWDPSDDKGTNSNFIVRMHADYPSYYIPQGIINLDKCRHLHVYTGKMNKCHFKWSTLSCACVTSGPNLSISFLIVAENQNGTSQALKVVWDL